MMLHRARLASFRKKQKWPGNVDTVEMSRAGFFYMPDEENPDNCECFFCGVNLSGWRVGDDPAREHLLCNPECQWARVIGTRDHTVSDRLGTFSNWPHPVRNFRPSPLALAQAGFYFNPSSNTDDSVECAFCNACLNKWEPEDSPLDVHLATSPECEYILQCFETSSLVESSLGVIPVLQPGTMSRLPPPNESYEQSVYENILENGQSENTCKDVCSTQNTSIKSRLDHTLDSSSVYETAVGMSPDASQCETPRNSNTSEKETPEESVLHEGTNANKSLEVSNTTLEAPSIRQGGTTPPSLGQNKSVDTSPSQVGGNTFDSGILAVPNESSGTVGTVISEAAHSDYTPASVQNSGGNETTGSPGGKLGLKDTFGKPNEIPGDYTESLHPSNDTSMVTVDVEEVSTSSIKEHEEDNLEDPETPNESRRTSEAPGRPALSVFHSAFTSTPFGRMSPTKMMSSAAMPSPLSRMPIDLGRTSFSSQAPHDEVAETVMYPRLPSFPSMHSTTSNNEIPSENTPFNEFDACKTSSAKLMNSLQTIEETSYRSIPESDIGRDHSTPSPIRTSQAHSFIVGSSPVKNSFDQLIQDLDVKPDSSNGSFLAPIPDFHVTPQGSHANSEINPRGLSLDSQTPVSAHEELIGQESLSIQITKPVKKELLDEFSRFLPQSSVDFLMEAKSQTVGEWQLLLADEVERQVLKVTEEAIQEAESHRHSVIARIRAQYGQ